jgi:hypothetical protein
MIYYTVFFLLPFLLRVEMHKLYLVGNCRPINLPSISSPCGCHPLGFAFPPLGPIKARYPCSWFLLGLLSQRQIPCRSHPIKSFSVLYLILFRLPLMLVLHLGVVLVILAERLPSHCYCCYNSCGIGVVSLWCQFHYVARGPVRYHAYIFRLPPGFSCVALFFDSGRVGSRAVPLVCRLLHGFLLRAFHLVRLSGYIY